VRVTESRIPVGISCFGGVMLGLEKATTLSGQTEQRSESVSCSYPLSPLQAEGERVSSWRLSILLFLCHGEHFRRSIYANHARATLSQKCRQRSGSAANLKNASWRRGGRRSDFLAYLAELAQSEKLHPRVKFPRSFLEHLHQDVRHVSTPGSSLLVFSRRTSTSAPGRTPPSSGSPARLVRALSKTPPTCYREPQPEGGVLRSR
jgi:hypothetical protein